MCYFFCVFICCCSNDVSRYTRATTPIRIPSLHLTMFSWCDITFSQQGYLCVAHVSSYRSCIYFKTSSCLYLVDSAYNFLSFSFSDDKIAGLRTKQVGALSSNGSMSCHKNTTQVCGRKRDSPDEEKEGRPSSRNVTNHALTHSACKH